MDAVPAAAPGTVVPVLVQPDPAIAPVSSLTVDPVIEPVAIVDVVFAITAETGMLIVWASVITAPPAVSFVIEEMVGIGELEKLLEAASAAMN